MLHIGNYVGALSLWAANQNKFDNLFCVADMYAIKDPDAVNPAKLREKTLELAALYLACGIDPEQSTIFVQSQVPAHAELMWILGCLTPVGWLQGMIQDESRSGSAEGIGTGVLTLPVLLAADILLYDTDLAPVGEDQKQHVEFVREIAQRFNALYGPLLQLPEPLIRESGARIMGLDDPTIKMSKSIGEARKGHMIGLLDSPEDIRNSIMAAATDSGNNVSFEHSQAGVKNLLVLYEVISGMSRSDIEEKFDGKGYGSLKKELAELLVDTLKPIQQKYHQIRDNADFLESVLAAGAEHAHEIADPRIKMIKAAAGFVPQLSVKQNFT